MMALEPTAKVPKNAQLADACRKAMAFHERLRSTLERLGPPLYNQGALPRLGPAWEALNQGVLPHIDDEDKRLLPALIALSEESRPLDDDIVDSLGAMARELDEVRALCAAVREAAPESNLLQWDLYSLLDELESHAKLEEEHILPAALALLGVEADIAREGPEPGRVIRQTEAVCPTCLERLPAEVVVRANEVVLSRTCPTHGPAEQLLSRAPTYWEDLDRYYFRVNDTAWPQRDYIVRMTERCNLDCPICLARANTEDTPDLDLTGLEALLSERRGIKIDLMAAEPTLRPDLEDWIRKVKQSGNIAALHTNGLRLAERGYAQRIKDAGVDEVFLQMDGFDDAHDRTLRGRPLQKAKRAALANLKELGIATSLIAVIGRGVNEDQVSRIYRFALEPGNEHIREVFYLGLRMLGSARDETRSALTAEQAMMPDELIDLLCDSEPQFKRDDIRRFNKLYFALLSAFKVRKCIYVQHTLVLRDGQGNGAPVAKWLDLPALERAAERYAALLPQHPHLARAGLLADLAKAGVRTETMGALFDLVRLQWLFSAGMNLSRVPPRLLLLGFITACDPLNWDARVSQNCGKGELSVDGGFTESGADANVLREKRFDASNRRPGELKRRERQGGDPVA